MELTLYSRKWCSWCIDAKDYLKEKGYRFEEIDVGKDRHAYAEKAGALGILAATFLGVYFVTGSWIWGFVGAMSWLFLPWLEILTRIRALRLPKEKRLRPKSPPSSDTFPALTEITREIEEEG